MGYGRRVHYIPSNRDLYLTHYRQAGGRLPVFRGAYQDGSGLLGDLFRSAIPLLKSTALSAGKTLFSSGAKVLSDIARGKDVKSSVARRGMEGLKEVGRDVLSRTIGAKKTRKRQRGAGLTRHTTQRPSYSTKRASNRPVDIFDRAFPPVRGIKRNQYCRKKQEH